MSTRCQIGFYTEKPTKKTIKEPEALIYRHSDGYPDTENGVLECILPFLKWWKTARGISDTEYISARLLQYMANKYDQQTIEIEKEFKTEKSEVNLTGTLGHGISKHFHYDIEYYYAIYPDMLEVYDVKHKCLDKKNHKYDWDNPIFKLIKTIEI